MFSELGELFGWLIVISFGGTLLNYIIKFIFKFLQKKKIKKYDAIMKILMKNLNGLLLFWYYTLY